MSDRTMYCPYCGAAQSIRDYQWGQDEQSTWGCENCDKDFNYHAEIEFTTWEVE